MKRIKTREYHRKKGVLIYKLKDMKLKNVLLGTEVLLSMEIVQSYKSTSNNQLQQSL